MKKKRFVCFEDDCWHALQYLAKGYNTSASHLVREVVLSVLEILLKLALERRRGIIPHNEKPVKQVTLEELFPK